MSEAVPAEIARHVRVLDALGCDKALIGNLTGVPVTLIEHVVREEGHEEQVRGDLALVAIADQGRMQLAGEPTPVECETVAQWLAEQSNHPRYIAVTDGWRRLLESTADVEVAYRAAIERLGSVAGLRSTQTAESLRSARDMLSRIAKAAEREREEAVRQP